MAYVVKPSAGCKGGQRYRTDPFIDGVAPHPLFCLSPFIWLCRTEIPACWFMLSPKGRTEVAPRVSHCFISGCAPQVLLNICSTQNNDILSLPSKWPTLIRRNDVKERCIYSFVYGHLCSLTHAIVLQIQGAFLKQFRGLQKREKIFLALLKTHLRYRRGHHGFNMKFSAL